MQSQYQIESIKHMNKSENHTNTIGIFIGIDGLWYVIPHTSLSPNIKKWKDIHTWGLVLKFQNELIVPISKVVNHSLKLVNTLHYQSHHVFSHHYCITLKKVVDALHDNVSVEAELPKVNDDTLPTCDNISSSSSLLVINSSAESSSVSGTIINSPHDSTTISGTSITEPTKPAESPIDCQKRAVGAEKLIDNLLIVSKIKYSSYLETRLIIDHLQQKTLTDDPLLLTNIIAILERAKVEVEANSITQTITETESNKVTKTKTKHTKRCESCFSGNVTKRELDVLVRDLIDKALALTPDDDVNQFIADLVKLR